MARISEFLTELDDKAERDLETKTNVVDRDDFPDVDTLLLEKRQWVRLRDVVAVVADLKYSTRLDFKQRPDTSARLYHAVIGSCARIVNRFQPNFVDIQGDGLFTLDHGEKAFERAMCAGGVRRIVRHLGAIPAAIARKNSSIDALCSTLVTHAIPPGSSSSCRRT